MSSKIERWLHLRVADVMSRDAVTISANATMEEAARVLQHQDISGAPVVDEMGRCVGVLSTKDITQRDHANSAATPPSAQGDDFAFVQPSPTESLYLNCAGGDSVSRHMHQAVQTVDEQSSLVDAAEILCSEHIHRLVVLDKTSRPLGVVSPLDLLSSLVRELKN